MKHWERLGSKEDFIRSLHKGTFIPEDDRVYAHWKNSQGEVVYVNRDGGWMLFAASGHLDQETRQLLDLARL